MPNVKVLLNENIEHLGRIGDMVSVKPGYARNYLLPEGLASIPTVGEIRRIQKRKELLEKQYQEEKAQAEEMVQNLNKFGDFVIYTRAGESGKLFGAITAKDIAERINSLLGLNIVKKQVQLKRAIGEIGEYSIKLKLHNEVTADIKFIIKTEEESA